MSEGEIFTFRVKEKDSGIRIDQYLSREMVNCSRSRIAALVREGYVFVGGDSVKPGYRIKTGERITAEIPPPESPSFIPEAIDLNVLYEDEHIIVINKSPGVVVHPAPGHYSGTIVNGLLYHYPGLEGIGDEIRAGIVHRLDKDTSGALLIAKNRRALESLSGQFASRKIQKQYLALVRGVMESSGGSLTMPIGRHKTDRKKMSVKSPKGREAVTLWEVLKRYPSRATLLKIFLETGRTHQIRVHFSAIGHPVVGDEVYGRKTGADHPLYPVLQSVKRQMLHAWRIGFTHPGTGEFREFTAPVPKDMECVIEKLSSLA